MMYVDFGEQHVIIRNVSFKEFVKKKVKNGFMAQTYIEEIV